MSGSTRNLLSYLRVMLAAWRDDPRDDTELLARFVEVRDEAAFTVLVGRHGPLVWRACRSLLGDTPDAEDAFQATFLALARKASQARIENTAGWLHRVSRRVALDIQIGVRRRRGLEQQLKTVKPPEVEAGGASRTELYAALEEELEGLPEQLRIPLMLRYLGGKTLEDAARIVGCSRRDLGRRLAKGEALLRERLERRELTAEIGSMAALLAGTGGAPAVPALLIGNTVQATLRSFSFPPSLRPSEAAALAEGVMKSILATKMKLVVVLLGATLCLAGGGLLAYQTLNAEKSPQSAEQSREGDPPFNQAGASARVDYYGDPLPQGARARLGTVRLRHPGGVNIVAFSPDGRTVVSGGRNGAICLWEVATGKEIRTVKRHPGQGSVMAFSPDGKIVASEVGGRVGVACLWEAATGKEIRTLKGYQKGISSVVFSPDSKIIALGAEDGTVCLWEAVSGRELCTLHGHKRQVFSVAFSPDGKAVASGGVRTVRLWEAATGKEIRTLEGHQEQVCSVAFSSDGKTVASGSWDSTVRLWEVATGKEIRILKGLKQCVTSVAFSPDGQTVISGAADGTMCLWETATGKEIRILKGHGGRVRSVRSVVFSPNGEVVASGNENGLIYLWETVTGKLIRGSEGHEGPIKSAAFSPDGRTVASGGWDGMVRLWETASGKPIRILQGHERVVCSVAFSPDGQTVVSGAADGTTRLWETATGKEIRTLKGHGGGVRSVAFSPDGKVVASGGSHGVRLWQSTTGKLIHNVPEYQGWVNSLSFTPDGKMLALATMGDDKMVHLWEVATGKEIRTLQWHQGSTCSVVFSSDGRIMALEEYDKKVHLWHLFEVATGKKIRTLKEGNKDIKDVQYGNIIPTSDGRVMTRKIMTPGSGVVQLWDLLNGISFSLTGHRGAVSDVVFSPDGKTIVSVSEDTTGLVWDLNDGAARPAAKLSPDVLPTLWADLANTDAAQAWRAILALASTPAQSVPLLRDRLQPVPAEARERLARLVAQLLVDLDADEFKVRRKAHQELEKLGSDAEPALRKALEGKPSTEMRKRLKQLLEPPGEQSFSEEFLRGLRAVAVLERVGTPQARQVLKTLAAGAAGFRLTQEAQAALSRLERVRAALRYVGPSSTQPQ